MHAARTARSLVILAIVVLASGCTSGEDASNGSSEPDTSETDTSETEQRFPDVERAEVTRDGDLFSVAATISSPYDSEQRYADAFRVLGPDGQELGVRDLTHPHADEQPFTRSLGGVEIPDGVESVTIEGRDLRNGWGGETAEAPVPGR